MKNFNYKFLFISHHHPLSGRREQCRRKSVGGMKKLIGMTNCMKRVLGSRLGSEKMKFNQSIRKSCWNEKLQPLQTSYKSIFPSSWAPTICGTDVLSIKIYVYAKKNVFNIFSIIGNSMRIFKYERNLIVVTHEVLCNATFLRNFLAPLIFTYDYRILLYDVELCSLQIEIPKRMILNHKFSSSSMMMSAAWWWTNTLRFLLNIQLILRRLNI